MPGALELAARDVDRHREIGSADRSSRHACTWRQASSSTQLAQLHDQAGLLRQRDEVLRQEVAVGLVLPADQRLDARGSRRCRGARSAGSGASARPRSIARAERGLHLQPVAHVGVHPRLVGLRAALAPALGRVHRHVGVAQQVVGGVARAPRWRRRCWRVTCTWLPLSVNGWLIAVASRSSSSLRPSGPAACSIRMANSSPPSRATVSAARAQREEPLRRGDQQPVALRVAEAVVDPLEVVEVEEEHRDRMGLRAAPAPARGSPGRGRARGWRDR